MQIGIWAATTWENDYWQNKTKLMTLGEVEFIQGNLDKDHLPDNKNYDAISVFVGSMIDEDVLNAFSNLKFIATRSTGFDHIDLKACEKKGVIVSNVPTYGQYTVAEYAFALLLTLGRRIYESYDRLRATGNFSFEGLRGVELHGKTIGVAGTGRIGTNVIKIAKGFGMEVLAYDPYPNKDSEAELGFRYVEFDELLSGSDFVTLHVPATPTTEHLINKETLAKMKKGSYLINTSRGSVVNTLALVEALKSGHLAGAALDVLEEEGPTKNEIGFISKGHPSEEALKTVLANHLLVDLPNVIVTPHNAFNTDGALRRILETTVENISAFQSGSPQNIVS